MKMMTKSALLLAAALIATPVAQASADTVPGWYAGLGAGVNFQNKTDNDTAGVPSFSFNQPGYDVLGNAGYAWSDGLRLEGEAFHSRAVVKDADGSLNNTDLFANALYDINLGSFLTPYVGAGVGVDFVDADNIGPFLSGNSTAHINGSSVKLAYQGIAGVAAKLDNEWEVTADYRYVASLDPKLNNNVGGKDRIDNASHNIILGVRYNFDSPAPVVAKYTEAPAVQSRVAAKPVVAPVPQTFQVFFDFNKADLTPEAKRIIASAAQEYKSGKFVRIVVTGHTDTVGSAKYNKGLSDRRAAAVKTEFASLGVNASVVVTQGVGKNGLLVPTNDGVREAQNRRAEIVLGKK
jgi:outer membrane protein OmpA-like peptidoglycan-associated protein